jgi:hypothetical protein
MHQTNSPKALLLRTSADYGSYENADIVLLRRDRSTYDRGEYWKHDTKGALTPPSLGSEAH